jgi:RNA polymerase sigma-70 factor (ECF subfamily)
MASLDEESMAACLRSALNGDQRAYRRFLQDITPVIRGIVRSRLAKLGEQSVEDVLQEALLGIHMKRHTWQQEQPVLPWVYAIARYKSIDALRRSGIDRMHTPIDDENEELTAVDTSPECDMDVATAVAQLDGRVQQVVRAMGIEGASAAETGSRLDISENAVRVAFHRGLAQLVKLRPRLTGERDLSR